MSDWYREYLRSDEWKKKRAERLAIDSNRCVICGSNQNLNVHHLRYERVCNEDVNQDLVTVCNKCHTMLHRIEDRSRDEYREFKEGRPMGDRYLMDKLYCLVVVEITLRDKTSGGDLKIFDAGQRTTRRLIKVLNLIYPEVSLNSDGFKLRILDTIRIARSARICELYQKGSSLNEIADFFGMNAANVNKVLTRHGFNYTAKIR